MVERLHRDSTGNVQQHRKAIGNGMLLIGSHFTGAHLEGFATYIFVVAVIVEEKTQTDVRSHEITTFEVHTPTACFISKIVT